jgi:conjugative relaxase-like TrwC/TraI family protein
MLSIGSIKSASGAAGYYAKDNYYTEGEAKDASEWFGKAAAALGLEGPVDPKVFEAVLRGQLPNGEQIQAGSKGHRAGFDLTFSAPKSLSLMALVGGDTRLLEAQKDAVKAALAFAQDRFANAGQGKQGRQTVATGNLVVALFDHDTSRARDPQVHTHAVIANVTQRPDDAWRALKNDALYQENKLLGALYHNELRTRVEALGYTIKGGGKNGMFEIAGISLETIDAWSKRSADIKAIAASIGATSPEAKGAIAARSRGGKAEIAPDALRAHWQSLAKARGEDFRSHIAAPAEPKPQRTLLSKIKVWGEGLLSTVMPFWRHKPDPLVQDADKHRLAAQVGGTYAVASAIRHLSERQATFKTADVLRKALNFAEQKAGIAEIEARFEKLVETDRLIVGQGTYKDIVTTPDMIATEKAIIAFAKTGVGVINSGPDDKAANTLIQIAAQTALGFDLHPEQRKAATAVLYGQNRVELVQGDSGSGKSTVFAAINAVPKNQRPGLMMLTNQSGLARDLEDASGIKTQTIASFLVRYEQLASSNRSARPEDKAEYKGKTLIIDEASMVSSRQMQGLFKIADKLGIERIALVGDSKQIPAIEAGRPFALLQTKLAPLTLTQNVRQTDPEMRKVVARLGAGDVKGAFDLLGTRVVETADPARAAAQSWLALDPERQAATQIYTAGHRLREGVLDALHQGQDAAAKAQGGKGPDRRSITLPVYENLNKTSEEMRHVQSYAQGMVLDVYRDLRSLGLMKGSYTVSDVNHAKAQVTLEHRDATGKQSTMTPSMLHPSTKGLSLSIRKQITLYEGDKIIATAKVASREVMNGDTFTLKAIEGEGDTARLRLEDKAGRAHLLERGDPMREQLGAAGALNMHRVQGQTTPHAITVLSEGDRMLNSQSLAYVLTSRAREGFTLFVDDKERVIQQIERNDGKAPHATEIAGDAVQTKETQALKPELPPLGIDNALREKLAALSKEADRTNTLPVPQKQLGLEL